MKKILSLLSIAMVVFASLIVFTGCGNNQKINESNGENVTYGYDLYTVETDYGKLSFEFPKDSGYKYTSAKENGKFYKSEDRSSIEVYSMNTALHSILMKETDFSKSVYKDYKEFEIAGHKAFSITYHSGTMTRIEMGILLDEYDKEHNKNYGVKVKVSQSALDKDGAFNPEEYVKTEGFQHMINSFKFTAKQ